MKKIIYGVIICACLVGLFVHVRTNNSVSSNQSDVIFKVSQGDDIVSIGKKLEEEKLIAHETYFYYYAWKNKLRGKFHEGQYNIVKNSTIAQIVYKLTTLGQAEIEKEKDISILFPEGWSLEKMKDRLNANQLPGDEFIKIAKKPSEMYYQEYNFLKRGESMEGYLFPDTYSFSPGVTADMIIQKMLNNFDKKVDVVRRELIISKGKNLHDIIIFASIIEGEVPLKGDRSIVAGVFQNRMDLNMALQSDATIDYIKGMSEIKHSQADIEIDSPYNTYKYPGLPAGPINNPSLASIDAAIDPTETEFMYFLNNAETGETVFSKTFLEHVENKQKHGL